MNKTDTLTQYENKVTQKAKNALYLVLKKKTFADEVINSLQVEIEKRFKKFLNNIAGDLERIKLEDEENGLKYIILRGMINILNEMLKERMILLSDKDKKIVNDIFEGQEENEEDLKEGKYKIPYKNNDQNFHQSGNKGKDFSRQRKENYSSPFDKNKQFKNGNNYNYNNNYHSGSQYPYGNQNPYGNQFPHGIYHK